MIEHTTPAASAVSAANAVAAVPAPAQTAAHSAPAAEDPVFVAASFAAVMMEDPLGSHSHFLFDTSIHERLDISKQGKVKRAGVAPSSRATLAAWTI
ncbi:hypothetical protein [Brevundimonas sp. UBA7534]|uniref:hypothetical protein n=1 Tax=Brevundimonas sp. UBA7534 TaxID=1946138 RepID=UPI0025BAFBDD|nr:hypothetical protein [Brevundimonas sp. UBA7534]